MPHPGLAGQRPLSTRSARRVSATYGLGQVVGVRPVPGGYLNNNYLVETARGRYFFKQYVGIRRADLGLHHRILRDLQETGLSVCAPLTNLDGQTFLVVGRRPLAVFPWIEGEHRGRGSLARTPLTQGDCQEIGALLGRIHRALAEADACAQQRFLLPPIQPPRTLARARDLLRRVRAQQPGDSFDALAEECLAFTIDLLRKPQGEIGIHPCVTPWQLTHGDFHPGNVIFGPDGSLTTIDWDRVRVQPRLFELIRAIVLFLADAQTGSIEVDEAWAMMRGYATVLHVESGAMAEIVDLFWWSKLNDLWMLDRHYVQGDRTVDTLLPSTVGWLRWLLAHRHTLAAALEDAAHVDNRPPHA
jgi:Ser/Thr protein kinase RdoA (MazF antagonist)